MVKIYWNGKVVFPSSGAEKSEKDRVMLVGLAEGRKVSFHYAGGNPEDILLEITLTKGVVIWTDDYWEELARRVAHLQPHNQDLIVRIDN
ncbi:hypothetical protein A2716_01980 [candidate division WWE3 bacterium RIFCSPHIGHO2_01_FULL_40_23]|uniref:Uncharacterized protein n=1 Tax=candidate division WWE3 bacterium RIFCSPLOWO2_01_FULL_41_18 TaxID=1802625 RepID=A0A1F4VF22_UNCKA|nr:MAG: hypothetical protein A2716_01980 [candidate division WWE3 bacterium RIFCSPHIGHO2_01_FULL_40_23]OGC55759.1 MAG: hypothetical protein A3A78_01830 [candidate division WWE3 bacterium RIFCSPLOWO2_01_FULL_41_18]